MNHSGDVGPTAVRAATRIYALSLYAFPRALRKAYASTMRIDFVSDAERTYAEGGMVPLLCLLLRNITDVLWRAPSEYRFERRLEAVRNVQSTYIPLGERMLRIVNDIRIAARTLARKPGFSIVVMITLALGIGANIAIFAVVNAVLIKPLPYPESDRIVVLEQHAPGLNLPDLDNSPGSIDNYTKNAHTFSAVGAENDGSRNLTGKGDPVRLQVGEITPGIFDVLRVHPEIGRRFLPEDTAVGAPAVAILTQLGWSKYFGGRPDVLDKSIELDGVSTRIIGIMPKGFAYPKEKTMLLVPMHIDYAMGYGSFGIGGIARLKPGVTMKAAQLDVEAQQSHIKDYSPEIGSAQFLSAAKWSANVVSMRDSLVKDAKQTLLIVLGTVGFLLLVACASVANLFLVRAEGRRREVGVRFALGASRARVAATFIAESLILGIAGGAWGMLIAFIALRGLIAAAPPELPRLNEIGFDWRVMLFAALVSVGAGIMFGLLPLPHRMRTPLSDLVRGGRGQTDGGDRQLLRKTLIVAQIALALMLLVGSGLMVRTFQRLRAVDPGVKPDNVLTVGMSVGKVKDRAATAALYRKIVDRVAELPGVSVASATNTLPIDPSGWNGGSFEVRNEPLAKGAIPPVAMYAVATDNYFKTMGTSLVEGHAFDRSDVDHGRNDIVVNQTFAHTLMKDKAVGKEINLGGDDTLWLRIVGVVKDMHTLGLRDPIKPMAYLPITTPLKGAAIDQIFITLRTKGDPVKLAPAVRAAVHDIAPTAPVTQTRTMNEVLATATADTSLTMTILALAAGVALLLGAIGLYGVIGYVVTQRTKEIGVRIALGAEPGRVGTMILRQGLVLSCLGVAAGLAGAAALSKVMQGLLFEVRARDPLTFIAVPVILLVISGLAAWLPARRAAAVSPMEALSAE